MQPLNKGTKVFVSGDWDVGIPDYVGYVVKYNIKNFYTIKDKFGNRRDVPRNRFKTVKDLKDMKRSYWWMG